MICKCTLVPPIRIPNLKTFTNFVTIRVDEISYDAYERAVEEANTLDRNLYEDFSGLEDALAVDVYEEDTCQATIDEATTRIYREIDALVEKSLVAFVYPSGEAGEDMVGDEKRYAASYGVLKDHAMLWSSLDGENRKTLEWSKEPYSVGHFKDVTVPVLAASKKNPWSENSYFEIQCTTSDYKDLVFSAELGATKKGPKEYALFYSLDGENYIRIEDSEASLTSNKKLYGLYSKFVLPKECANQEKLFLRICVNCNLNVSGSELYGSTGGEVALNQVYIQGTQIPVRLVTFESNGGTAVTDAAVKEGALITEPEGMKKVGFFFRAWYVDEELTELWDFISPVMENMSLYAGWTPCEHENTSETKPLVEATCTKTGLTAEFTCDDCAQVTQVQSEVDMLEHEGGTWVVVTPATYSSTGLREKYCVHCGAVVESDIIERLTYSSVSGGGSGGSFGGGGNLGNSEKVEEKVPEAEEKVPEVEEKVPQVDTELGTPDDVAVAVVAKRNKLVLTTKMLDQYCNETADTNLLLSATDDKGAVLYTLKVNAADIKSQELLWVYKIDDATGKYVMVNNKSYKLNKSGKLGISLENGFDYELVNSDDAKRIEKTILSTVKLSKKSVTVKGGQRLAITMSKKMNTENVKNITYKVSNSKMGKVSKKGVFVAKKKGSAVVKVVVTLMNGSKKTLNMKVVCN